MRDLKHLIAFENLLQEANNELVRQGKADGKRALGYTCYFMPEVLLDLPGCFAVRLRAPKCTSPDMATYYMSSRTCHYGRSLFERALEGGYNFLDADFGTETCTVTCRFQEHLGYMDVIQNPDFFVTFTDVPFKRNQNSIEHYEGQLQAHVLDPLHEKFGIDISDEALMKAIDLHNEISAVINEIGDYRKLDNPTITGYEFQVIQLCSLVCPKELILPMLKETAKELKTRKPDKKSPFRCKVVLADQLASLWTALERIGFAYLSAPLAWFGAVGYSLQLYYDFAGYSLMAMGLARMLGFVIPRNFDLPYCSRSISEFWRRWHITLGIWFRDYLYIPLGGSRNGKRRLFLSLFVVWTLTGLWHGAAWNFVLWGLVLFVFIALEKFCIGGFLERHRFLSRLYFLFLIPQTWVVFRISDLGELGDYFSRLYPFLSSGESVFAGDLLRQLKSYWWLFALGILLATPWPRRFYEKYRATPLVWLPLFAVFWLCLYLIATGTGNPFLYARF